MLVVNRSFQCTVFNVDCLNHNLTVYVPGHRPRDAWGGHAAQWGAHPRPTQRCPPSRGAQTRGDQWEALPGAVLWQQADMVRVASISICNKIKEVVFYNVWSSWRLQMLQQSKYFCLVMQAVAPTGQGDPSGFRWHSRQTAINGGPKVQHPQVCSGGLRPRHDPPEPGQPQPRLCDLQLPVEGVGDPTASHCASLLGLKASGVLTPLLLPVGFIFTLWSEESVVHYQTTIVWHSSGVCFCVIAVDAELQVWMKLTFWSRVAAVSKC